MASVWAVFAVGVLAVVVGVVLLVGQAVLGRHRAGGAADLAALAVADHALQGRQAACATGARVARAQRSELVRCAVSGEIADVTVRAAAGPFESEVRARAGPAHVAGVPPEPAAQTPQRQRAAEADAGGGGYGRRGDGGGGSGRVSGNGSSGEGGSGSSGEGGDGRGGGGGIGADPSAGAAAESEARKEPVGPSVGR